MDFYDLIKDSEVVNSTFYKYPFNGTKLKYLKLVNFHFCVNEPFSLNDMELKINKMIIKTVQN